jgi:hypothetical protein
VNGSPVPEPLTISLTEPKVALVEGKDEVNVLRFLLAHLGIADVQLFEVGGRNKLSERFPTFAKHPDLSKVNSYLVIQDADADANAAFNRVCHVLKSNGQPVPPAVGAFTTTTPRVGVFICPGGGAPGMLEDVYLNTYVAHPLTAHVTNYFAAIQAMTAGLDEAALATLRPFDKRPKNMPKAKARAFLAAAEDDVRSLGLAAEMGYWKFDHAALAPLTQALQAL